MNWRWDDEAMKKVTRLSIAALIFLCVSNLCGLSIRASHQLLFSLFVIVISSLFCRNIWATVFVWWSSLLFIMSRFEVGAVYMTNIFYGTMLYCLTKNAFQRRHINFFANAILWLLFANLAYGIIQVLGYDFIYNCWEHLNFMGIHKLKACPSGFMSNSGIMASLICMAFPIWATRSRLSIYPSLLLVIPIIILHSSVAVLTFVVTAMFILFHRVKLKIWLSVVVLLVLCGISYCMFFDAPGYERAELWKSVMADAYNHPVIGWGMDTFRNFNSKKPFIYVNGPDNSALSKWDNPHNLLISLVYEFGFVSLFFLIGYIRHIAVMFKSATKTPNAIGFTGFFIAFLVVSMANFPIFLCRLAVLIIPCLALMEVELNG